MSISFQTTKGTYVLRDGSDQHIVFSRRWGGNEDRGTFHGLLSAQMRRVAAAVIKSNRNEYYRICDKETMPLSDARTLEELKEYLHMFDLSGHQEGRDINDRYCLSLRDGQRRVLSRLVTNVYYTF